MRRGLPMHVLATLPRGREKGRRGLSIVESAVALSLFLMLLLGFIDMGRAFFAKLTMQHAVREAGRFGVTGPAQGQTPSQHHAAIVQKVVDAAAPLSVPLGSILVSGNGSPGNSGGPGDTLKIEVTYDVPLLTFYVGQWFPNGVYTVKTSVTFKNEPFPQPAGP